jgi:type II secretory pathway component PulM
MKGFSNSRLALTVSAGDAIDNWTAPWRARWRALAPRERRGLSIAAWVLGLFVLWALAIAPAWRTVRAAPTQLDQLDVQLQGMQRQANEARELRAIAPLSGTQAAAAWVRPVKPLAAPGACRSSATARR